jgi:hypothetical protein
MRVPRQRILYKIGIPQEPVNIECLSLRHVKSDPACMANVFGQPIVSSVLACANAFRSGPDRGNCIVLSLAPIRRSYVFSSSACSKAAHLRFGTEDRWFCDDSALP